MHDIAFYFCPKSVELTNQLLSRIDFTTVTQFKTSSSSFLTMGKKASKKKPHGHGLDLIYNPLFNLLIYLQSNNLQSKTKFCFLEVN